MRGSNSRGHCPVDLKSTALDHSANPPDMKLNFDVQHVPVGATLLQRQPKALHKIRRIPNKPRRRGTLVNH